MNQRQQHVIEYLIDENRVLREQIANRRMRFTNNQGCRLASGAKKPPETTDSCRDNRDAGYIAGMAPNSRTANCSPFSRGLHIGIAGLGGGGSHVVLAPVYGTDWLCPGQGTWKHEEGFQSNDVLKLEVVGFFRSAIRRNFIGLHAILPRLVLTEALTAPLLGSI
jgi:hypothetical protein